MDKDQLQLRRQVGQLFDMIEETQKLAETTARAQDTRRTALMPGESMQIMDADGNVAAYFGGSNASGQLIEYATGPEPKRPSAPELDSPMPGVITVIADGQDEDGEEARGNHDRVLIHLSHEEGFTPTEATAQHSFFGPEGRQDVSAEPGEWYVAIQWRTKSGQLSEPSEQAFVEVLELVNSADIKATLEESRQRLADAMKDFEEGNETRRQEIENLNDVVLPALEQSLTEAMTELEERVGDVDLSHLETALAELNETRLPALEAALAGKAESSELPVLEGRLTTAFGEGFDAAVTTASEDATAKANAAQEAAEAEAGRLAKAEAQAAQSAAEQAAAQDALDKANAARDAAIESASGDAQEKADAAKEAAEAAAAADAKAKADAAQAEAIRQAALDATAKADAAKAAAENAAKDYADQQDVILKGEAAADAQTKADAVLAEAQEALEFYASRGDNLIFNGSFERGGVGWRTSRGEIVQTNEARTGDHALLLGREHANDYPMSDWFATAPGRVYLTEYWAKKLPGGTNPRELRVYSQYRLADGSTPGGYARNDQGDIALAQAVDLPENEWVKVTGTLEIIRPTATEASFGPHILATGTQFYIDDFRVVDITDAKAALDAAKAAQARADEAHQDAGGAWAHADAAMSRAGAAEANAIDHADALPKVLHGTGAPSGTAPNGSIWWQHQGSLQGAVTAQWNRVGGSWVSTPIDSEAIANLDVGKLTAGGAVISDAVIQDLTASNGAFDRLDAREGWVGGVALEDGAVTARTVDVENVFTNEAVVNTLWADRIQARVAELSSLIVASGNMFPNGDLALGADNWDSSFTLVEDAAQAPPGYDSHLQTSEGQGTVSYPIGDYMFAAQGGKEYLFEMWVKADKPGSVFFWDWRDENGTMVGASGGDTWAIEPASGHSHGTRVVSEFTVPTEWTRIQTAFRLTPDATRIHPRAMYFNHPSGDERNASISIGGVRLVPRNGAEVIVDGAITTRHLVAEAVKAANIDVQSLVADEAFVNTVWAEVVRTGLLTAEEALIGGALLKEGIIDADKINAESVTAAVAQFLEIEAGMIKANAFEGMTFTGGTFRGTRFETHEGAEGVKMTPSGLAAYRPGGDESFRVDSDTGDVVIRGESDSGGRSTLGGEGLLIETPVTLDKYPDPNFKDLEVIARRLNIASYQANMFYPPGGGAARYWPDYRYRNSYHFTNIDGSRYYPNALTQDITVDLLEIAPFVSGSEEGTLLRVVVGEAPGSAGFYYDAYLHSSTTRDQIVTVDVSGILRGVSDLEATPYVNRLEVVGPADRTSDYAFLLQYQRVDVSGYSAVGSMAPAIDLTADHQAMTFYGASEGQASMPVLKLSTLGLQAWNEDGQTVHIGSGENYLVGRLYTNTSGKPGIILNPDYGPDSTQGPGVWFSESGGVDADQPAIWVDKDAGPDPTYQAYWLTIRGRRVNGVRERIRVQGGIQLEDGPLMLPNGYGFRQDGSGSFSKLEANRSDFRGHSYFHSQAHFEEHAKFNRWIYATGSPESTGAANVRYGGTGDYLLKVTSKRSAKVNIETVPRPLSDRLLDLEPRWWIDRRELEDVLDCKSLISDTDEGPVADPAAIEARIGEVPSLIPGLVAEEVEEAGLSEYALYDENEGEDSGELSGVAYDRLWTLLIPLIREHRDQLAAQSDQLAEQEERISDLEDRNASLEERLVRLEAMIDD